VASPQGFNRAEVHEAVNVLRSQGLLAVDEPLEDSSVLRLVV